MQKSQVSYDPETDALGITLSDKPSVESYEAAAGVVIAVDEDGDAVGIEVLGGTRDLFAPLIDQVLSKEQRRAAS